MEFTAELIEKAKFTKNAEELLELASENGIELTEEEAVGYFDQLNPKTGSLSDEELDNVAGGTCYHNNKKVVTEMNSCSNFKHSQYANSGCRYICQNCCYCARDYSSIATSMRLYCMYDKWK